MVLLIGESVVTAFGEGAMSGVSHTPPRNHARRTSSASSPKTPVQVEKSKELPRVPLTPLSQREANDQGSRESYEEAATSLDTWFNELVVRFAPTSRGPALSPRGIVWLFHPLEEHQLKLSGQRRKKMHTE